MVTNYLLSPLPLQVGTIEIENSAALMLSLCSRQNDTAAAALPAPTDPLQIPREPNIA